MLRIMAGIAIPTRINAAEIRIVATTATRTCAGTLARMTAAIERRTTGTMAAHMATVIVLMVGAASIIAATPNGATITA